MEPNRCYWYWLLGEKKLWAKTEAEPGGCPPCLLGAPELCDGNLTGRALHPGPRAGRQGDGGHLPRHARPGGLWGAPGPAETVCLPILTLVLKHTRVRRRNFNLSIKDNLTVEFYYNNETDSNSQENNGRKSEACLTKILSVCWADSESCNSANMTHASCWL